MLSEFETELDRGLALQAEGKTKQALSVFDSLITRLRLEPSSDLDWIAVCAWQGKCRVLARERRWQQTLDACNECLARYGDGTSAQSRWSIGDIRWLAALATARLSVAGTGERGDVAHRELDALIEWLRTQPDGRFRVQLAERLADKMRWRHLEDEGLDALEELVRVLRQRGDAEMTRRLADAVVGETPWLFAVGHDEEAHLSNAFVRSLEGSGVAPGLGDVGLGDRTAGRMARLARSLNDLADLLGKDRFDMDAAVLRAALLINVSTAFGRLSRAKAVEDVLTQVEVLGDAALAACDRLVRDALKNEAEGYGNSTATVVAASVFKARFLAARGDNDTAISTLTDVIETLEKRTEPPSKSVAQQLRHLLEELESEPDVIAAPGPSQPLDRSQTTSGGIVWRLKR